MIANIRKLRSSTKEIFQAIDRGDTVIITNRGKPCAKLVPVPGQKSKIPKNSELFGMWDDNEAVSNVQEFISDVRKHRHTR